jgi:hypothetical protein
MASDSNALVYPGPGYTVDIVVPSQVHQNTKDRKLVGQFVPV